MEIHLKIGGDNGGESFKMSFKVANVENINRKDNNVVFSIFEAKDYSVIIKLGAIKELQEFAWQ